MKITRRKCLQTLRTYRSKPTLTREKGYKLVNGKSLRVHRRDTLLEKEVRA